MSMLKRATAAIKKLALKLSGTSRRWRIIAAGIILSVSLFAYFLISFLSVSREEIALAELEESFRTDPICHEECDLWRRGREKTIVSGLAGGSRRASRKLERRISDYWREIPDNLRFKAELVEILSLAKGSENPPSYICEYLNAKDSDPELLREIIRRFNSSAANNQVLARNLAAQAERATSSALKIAAIRTLAEIDHDGQIEEYFNILESEESLEIKQEAIRNISNIREKKERFTAAQLEIIKKLALAPETGNNLRPALILLLGDYYLVFPEASAEIWRSVYRNEALDNISRAFSADNLNHLEDEGLELPAVSAAEWAAYYGQ